MITSALALACTGRSLPRHRRGRRVVVGIAAALSPSLGAARIVGSSLRHGEGVLDPRPRRPCGM